MFQTVKMARISKRFFALSRCAQLQVKETRGKAAIERDRERVDDAHVFQKIVSFLMRVSGFTGCARGTSPVCSVNTSESYRRFIARFGGAVLFVPLLALLLLLLLRLDRFLVLFLGATPARRLLERIGRLAIRDRCGGIRACNGALFG